MRYLTMAEKKITKVEMFTMIKALDEVKANANMVAFIDHEIELLQKKSEKKGNSKASQANAEFLADVKVALTALGTATATEVMKELVGKYPEVSNQKVSAHLRKLVKAEEVVRTEEKGKAYFSLA